MKIKNLLIIFVRNSATQSSEMKNMMKFETMLDN